MRGGDRLVNEYSWMSGICFSFYHSTYCCGDFKRSQPLISLFCQSVPKCRLTKNPASPRGKPRTQKPLVITIQRASQLRGFRVAKLAARCGAAAGGRLRASPTGAVETMSLQQPTKYTPSASLCSAAPPTGEPRRLCRSGRLSLPYCKNAKAINARIPYRH